MVDDDVVGIDANVVVWLLPTMMMFVLTAMSLTLCRSTSTLMLM